MECLLRRPSEPRPESGQDQEAVEAELARRRERGGRRKPYDGRRGVSDHTGDMPGTHFR